MAEPAVKPAAAVPSCHSDATDRLNALAALVTRFVPAIGERAEGMTSCEDDASPELIEERDATLVAALQAIRRIADATAPNRTSSPSTKIPDTRSRTRNDA